VTSSTTVEGTVYTADPITNLLVLSTAPTSSTTISTSTLALPTGAYRIFPLAQIQSFTILSLVSAAASTSPSAGTPVLDTHALQARLSSAISKQQAAQHRIGPKGTSATDQGLYDALSRTHPVRWEGSNIVVSDTFVIERPFSGATVNWLHGAGKEGRKGDLERMRKVVIMEREKVALRVGQKEVEGRMSSVTGGGTRKGG
jgi:protein LSM12